MSGGRAGIRRFEDTVDALVDRYAGTGTGNGSSSAGQAGQSSDGDGDGRTSKRRKTDQSSSSLPAGTPVPDQADIQVEADGDEVDEVAGDGAGEASTAARPAAPAVTVTQSHQASPALALAFDSPFVAIVTPHALARLKPAVAPASSAKGKDKCKSKKDQPATDEATHPPLEWVGICEATPDSNLDAPATGGTETTLKDLGNEPVDRLGTVDITVKWTLEDSDDLLLIEDGIDAENGDHTGEGDASELFYRVRTLAETGLELKPVVSFRKELFRRHGSNQLIEVPILVCRVENTNNGGSAAAPAMVFAKPLVHPDVRLSTTGRYDSGLPMSIFASDVAVPMGHSRRHRPAPTLLHSIEACLHADTDAKSDFPLATANATLSVTCAPAEDCISLRLVLPLVLPAGTTDTISHRRSSESGYFNYLSHDLLNHLRPAAPALRKDGKPLTREPRLEDLGGEIRDLYSAVLPDKAALEANGSRLRQPDELECNLLPFQKRTVQWMLSREGVVSTPSGLEPSSAWQENRIKVHQGGFWEKIGSGDDAFYLERMTGAMSKVGPRDGDGNKSGDLGGYGILAEEMGLGKTVEVLSLVLAHKPGPRSQPTVQPLCVCSEPVDNGAINLDEDEDDEGSGITHCSSCKRAFHARCVGSGEDYLCSPCKGKGKNKATEPLNNFRKIKVEREPFIPATLIVTPQSILAQWIEEINQHASSTNVIVYSGVKTGIESASDVVNGMKSRKKGNGKKNKRSKKRGRDDDDDDDDDEEATEDDESSPDFAGADVVLTTYEVLQSDIWHAKEDSTRERRYERRYERKSSPLVKSRWWRVCLDEAQRVESGVSYAAEMVGLIPRVHAWVVTGTPIGKAGIQDLHGLFLFLKQPKMLMDSVLFRRATLGLPSHRNVLLAVLASIMHRNSKDHVKEDLTIPPQEEHIFPVSLKEVEREYYLQRWEACQEELAAVLNGDPDADLADLDVSKLRRWLLTLRQTCVHPQIGQQNKRALGTQLIKSINDVLLYMLRQCGSDLNTAERQVITVQIRRAQALEHRKQFQAALGIYQNLLADAEKQVAEARKQLASDRALFEANGGDSAKDGADSDTGEASEAAKETEDAVSGATARLNGWLEMEHRLVFFMASVYHSLKNQAQEDKFYERAEAIRQEILAPRIQEVEQAKARVLEIEGSDKFNLRIAPSTFKGGITAQTIAAEAEVTITALNKQADNMTNWRKKVLDVLMTDLDHAEPENAEGGEDGSAEGVAATNGKGASLKSASSPTSMTDSAKNRGRRGRKGALESEPVPEPTNNGTTEGPKKPQGNEYQTGLKLQEDANVYHDAYFESILDRITALTGAPRPQESKLHVELSDLLKQLTKERAMPKGLKDLKAIVQAFRTHGQGRMGVPDVELQMCQNEARRLNKELERSAKLVDALQKENRLISKLQNARIEYYRALQDLSDSVEVGKFTEGDVEDNYGNAIKSCLEEEKRLKNKILQLDGRKKYLHHLSAETPEGESRLCVICREEYDNAAITPCGHFFCLPCLTQWVNNHRKCPTCNSSISVGDITRVSFNSTKRKGVESTLASALRRVSSFCTMADDALVSKVNRTHISGSFGSKLDTIIRHILSLEDNEKVVVFSQWDQVLDFLANGLAKNGIRYVRFQGAQRNRAAVQFRRDKDIRVFILDAKSQSSGLTLVNATHVMLVEPILHPGIELQAINRVHRIGQNRTTHVWRYLVSNTIEEGLFELYESRRLAVAGRGREEDADEEDEETMGPDVENARMLPLTNRGGTGGAGGGELVRNTDIISLLKSTFGEPEQVVEEEDHEMAEKD